MVAESFYGPGAFALYFGLSLAALLLFKTIYTLITPHDEWALVKKNNSSYFSSPVFRSTRSGSSGYYGLNEQSFGNKTRKFSVTNSAYTRTPAKAYTATTVRRGGFGSTTGKSYSSSSRSWGG